MHETRYALRLLTRQKRYAALAIATMALGIGILTTLCSVAYSVLLKPLPWPAPRDFIRLRRIDDFLPSIAALHDSSFALHEMIGGVYYRLRY